MVSCCEFVAQLAMGDPLFPYVAICKMNQFFKGYILGVMPLFFVTLQI